MQTAKTLIRLGRCPGWSESSLGAHAILLVLSRGGSYNCMIHINWTSSHENVSSGIFDQVRFKPACSTTETSYNCETLAVASIHIVLSKQRTTKVLIRLCGYAGWSAPLLFAYGIRPVFTWPGPTEHSHDFVTNKFSHY